MKLGRRTANYLVSLLLIYFFGINPVNSYVCLDKSDTPNFQQDNSNFADDGKDYCCPTSVSNALMWLGTHSYPDLIPKAQNNFLAQKEMISILGSSHYMDTNNNGGTTLPDLIRGLTIYVQASNYSVSSVQYKGISSSPEKYRTGNFVDLPWTAANVPRLSGVCLGIGWYKYHANKDTYTRTGGHLVTVVGYKYERCNDHYEPIALIVHNPLTTEVETWRFERIKKGTLLNPSNNSNGGATKQSAAGNYKVVEGLQSSETAIVNYSLAFYLKHR